MLHTIFFQLKRTPSLIAVVLLATQVGVVSARSDGVLDADSEPSVEVTALRMERGVRPQRMGEHVITYVYWVESKASLLNLSCTISDLTISDSRKSADVSVQPLHADTNRGCRIEAPGAIATIGGGQFKIAQFNGGKASRAGGQQSEYVTFQTPDNNAFAQDVYVTVFWKQTTPMQLSGTYEGAVKLVAKIPNDIEVPK